jgi:hypothetical protein
MAKLTEAQVREIRELRERGYGIRTLCSIFGVSRWTISDVVYRKAWKHVP